MALADLAQEPRNNPTSLKDISLRQGISLLYLEQIFLKLKNKEIVYSIRGPYGGYKLSKKPEDIKLSIIFSAVDEEIKTVKCNKKSKRSCNGKSIKCITHNLWDEVETLINTFFDNKSLKDVLEINHKMERIN
jgi:Rrf2 family iron-sulfur cluster assembly transcriptional regulator